jgi:malate synthase
MSLPQGVHLTLAPPKGGESILSTEALEFLVVLHRTFDARRRELLENRKKVQAELDKVCVYVSDGRLECLSGMTRRSIVSEDN